MTAIQKIGQKIGQKTGQKIDAVEPGFNRTVKTGVPVLQAFGLPKHSANTAAMCVEVVFAGEAYALSEAMGQKLAELQGRGLPAPEMSDLRGEQSELEKVAAADVVIVYGDVTEQLRRSVEQMRAARLTFPIVAFRDERCQPDNPELLRAGFDDVFDSSMPMEEIAARVKGMYERAQVYQRRNSLGLSLRRGGSGEAPRDVFSGRERTILTLLQENQGRIVTYQEILNRIGKAATTRAVHTLQVTMSGLRQKLSDEWKILGINRTGYILVMNGVAQSDMPEQVFG